MPSSWPNHLLFLVATNSMNNLLGVIEKKEEKDKKL
jgi:hypothetical protein